VLGLTLYRHPVSLPATKIERAAEFSDDVGSVYGLRLPRSYTGIIVAVWVALIAFLAVEPLQDYLNYFSGRDPRFRWALAALLVGLVVGAWLYARVRRTFLWRWEPVALTAVAAVLLFAYEPVGTLTIVWIAISAFTLGRELLARMKVDGVSTSAELALSLGTGIGVLIVVLIPLGLAGLYGPVLFAVLLLLPILLFRRRLLDLWAALVRLNTSWREMPECRSNLIGIAVAFAAVFQVVFLMAALTPTISKDAISYHVPAAQYYLESGYLEPLPSLDMPIGDRDIFSQGHASAYSYYPQSYEEVLTVALAIGGWPAMQFTAPLFYLLGLLVLSATGGTLGLTRFQRVIGLVGAISLPFAHWSGSTIKNDMAMASFQLLAFFCVFEAWKRKTGPWLILAAAFLGLSFGVKHVALFGGIPIGLLILYVLWRRKHRWRWLAFIALAFTVSGTFWHVRAYVMKGSPVYPAHSRIAVHQFDATDRSSVPRAQVYMTYAWIAHFQGSKVIELPIATPCGFFIAFLVIAWPLTKRASRSRSFWFLLTYFGLYYIYWIWVWGVLRYGIAPFLVIALLVGGRAAALWASGSNGNRLVIASAMTAGLLGAVPPLLVVEVNAPQLRYLAGLTDRDGYLEAANRFYPSIRELNGLMETGELAIAINNCARGYTADPFMVQCLDPGYITEQERDQITALLRTTSWNYLLVSNTAIEKRLGDLALDLNLEQVYSDAIYGIYVRRPVAP
jgi:hypothetical protein